MKYVLALLLSGCLQPGAEVCGNLLCPAGKTCAPGLDVCIFPEQVMACTGITGACHFDAAAGTCRNRPCILASCGNGIVEPPERCDDGVNDGTACSSDCLSDLRCGNAILDPHESCDCGDGSEALPFGCSGPNSDDNTATCSTHCTLHGCGDGVVVASEQCDPAAPTNAGTCADFGFYETTPLTCTAFCRYDLSPCSQRCGDHIVNGTEICDGSPPPETCLDYNYDAGNLGCQNGICLADSSGCRRTGWVRSTAPSTTLTHIFVNRPGDVYAIDESAVYHLSGHWVRLPVPANLTPLGVWASDPDDIFVIGNVNATDGGVYHYDGTTFTLVVTAPNDELITLWGVGRGDAYFGSVSGSIWHWNGTATSTSPTSLGIGDIRARAANDVYAVAGSSLLHFNGRVWSVIATAPTPLLGLIALPPNRVVARTSTGIIWLDSGVWTAKIAGYTPTTGWGNRTDNIFTGGIDGHISHYDGTVYVDRGEPFNDKIVALSGDPSGREIWALTDSWLLRYQGAEWQVTAPAPPPNPFSTVTAIASLGEDSLFIAGGTSSSQVGIAQLANGAWTQHVASYSPPVGAIWASSATDVWLGTVHALIHWNGSTFVNSGVTVNGVESMWGSGPGDIYLIDLNLALLHYNGFSWSRLATLTVFPIAVWGSSAVDVFIVGFGGSIRHYDGTTWQDMTSPVVDPLNAVWGSGPHDVFAVGDTGVVLHYDGSSWSPMSVPTSSSLNALYGTSADDVFAASNNGTILHWDGTSWSLLRQPAVAGLTTILAQQSGVYFGTTDGQIAALYRTELPWP